MIDPYPSTSLNDDDAVAVEASGRWAALMMAVRHKEDPTEPTRRLDHRVWDDSLICHHESAPVQSRAPQVTLGDMGYSDARIDRAVGETLSGAAIFGPFKLLSSEGTERVKQEAVELLSSLRGETCPANADGPIVYSRVRSADARSGLFYSLARSAALMKIVSELCGVRVVPHPHAEARVQINHYAPGGGGARWHRDGMNVVLTILLTDMQGISGGRYVFNSSSGECRVDRMPYPKAARMNEVPFLTAGEAIVTRGNRVDHCVTPTTDGDRITVAFSYYVVGARRHDANRFSHSVPDDGVARAAITWWHLRAPWRTDESLRNSAWSEGQRHRRLSLLL
jgi:hypothetical protein